MNWLNSKLTPWITGALAVAMQAWITLILLDVDTPLDILIHQTTFSPIVFEDYLLKWGPDRTATFLTHYLVDFVYPFVYAAFLASLLARTKLDRRWLPAAAGACDLIENVFQLTTILGWTASHSPFFYVGALAANVKWVLVATSLAAWMYGFKR